MVVAGPNGAGKTTTAPTLLRRALAVEEFVNADAVALGLSAFRPESAAMAAGRAMLARLDALAQGRRDFAFETTLASRSFAPWIRRLRQAGYRAHLSFLSLPSADLACARVAGRVRSGGHHVAEDVIRRRYVGGLRNFFELYEPVIDAWEVFDNSLASGPRLIAARSTGAPVVLDAEAWSGLREACR